MTHFAPSEQPLTKIHLKFTFLLNQIKIVHYLIITYTWTHRKLTSQPKPPEINRDIRRLSSVVRIVRANNTPLIYERVVVSGVSLFCIRDVIQFVVVCIFKLRTTRQLVGK